jgi:hypothetical protein
VHLSSIKNRWFGHQSNAEKNKKLTSDLAPNSHQILKIAGQFLLQFIHQIFAKKSLELGGRFLTLEMGNNLGVILERLLKKDLLVGNGTK